MPVTLACLHCKSPFGAAARSGQKPRYCSEGCRKAASRLRRRSRYIPAAERHKLRKEASDGYWLSRSGARRNTGVTVRSALEEALSFTVNRSDSGLRKGDRWHARKLPLLGSGNPDGKRFPSDKHWADKGADLDIETIRLKDRTRFGGPAGAWRPGTTPREPGWMTFDEWLALLPDDSPAWSHGSPVNPSDMF
ncbi:MAG TPA: hypothetical protein VKV80_06290 [Streptosporangiaceae bacterium]|jgi:hypothetical protein|nr:hypothetical protein [Streptosporangiaceae bacterium]